MQTVTGRVRLIGAENVLPFGILVIYERIGQLAGNQLATTTTDGNGDFSFQMRPGTYFLVYGTDRVAFRITDTAGSTTIDKLIEL